jgi:hypothetical protein
MKPLLLYILQMIIASGILYSYYYAVLRNKKFHLYNRYYLLGAVFISVLVPFLNIPVYFTTGERAPSAIYQTLTAISVGPGKGTHNAFMEWIITLLNKENLPLLIYFSIAAFILFRFIKILFSIKKIINVYPVEKVQSVNFINTDEPGTPFSFFNFLFWNREIPLDSTEGHQIFRHELYHIKHKHSWDVIILQFATTIFWINPFFILIRKELKAIHEFLADRFAANKDEEWNYAELLLKQVLGTRTYSLTNPFFHTQIKRRIAMLTNPQKTSCQYLRKLMALPIAIVLVALFAFSYKEKGNDVSSKKNVEKITRISILPDTITPVKVIGVQLRDTQPEKKTPHQAQPLIYLDGKYRPDISFENLGKKISPNDIQSVNVWKDEQAIEKFGNKGKNGVIEIITKKYYNSSGIKDVVLSDIKNTDTVKPITVAGKKIFDKTEVAASFPGGKAGWRQYLQQNLNPNVPVSRGASSGAYTVFVQFIVDEDGNVSNIKPLTKQGYGMEEEVVNLIKKGPKWVPAMQNGKKVTSYVKQPVTFVIQEEGKKQ